MRYTQLPSAVLIAGCVFPYIAPALALDYYWDAAVSAPGVGGNGSWNDVSPNWRQYSASGAAIAWPDCFDSAFFDGSPGIVTVATPVTANALYFGVDGYTLGGASVLSLMSGRNSSYDSVLGPESAVEVSTGNTLISVPLGGSYGLGKRGAGRLTLESSVQYFYGDVTLNAGESGEITATETAIESAFRNNAVTVKSTSGLFFYDGPPKVVRTGGMNGRNNLTTHVNLGTSGLIQHLESQEEQEMASAVVLGSATRGLDIRGTGVQTYSRLVSDGPVTVSGHMESSENYAYGRGRNSTRLELGGLSKLLAPGHSLALRGGAFIADNSEPAVDRLRDDMAVTIGGGGHFILKGGPEGTPTDELTGPLLLRPGAAGITVLHDSTYDHTGTGTTLTFEKSGSIRSSPGATVEFHAKERDPNIGDNLTLGLAGDSARVLFTGTIFTGTGGMLSDTASGPGVGWAVTGAKWAGYDPVTGVIPLPEINYYPVTLETALPTELVSYQQFSSTITVSAPLTVAALRLRGEGLLNFGAHDLVTNALMLDSPVTQLSMSAGRWTGAPNSSLHAWVLRMHGQLKLDGAIDLAPTRPLVKAGEGTLVLNGSMIQLAPSAPSDIYLLQGALHGSAMTLGNGANTTLQMRGGVIQFEGGTHTRALDSAGTAAGGGLVFDAGPDDHGGGGFAAQGGDATMTLVTTPGGSTPAVLAWNDGAFLADGDALILNHSVSDSTITLTNDLVLDPAGIRAYQCREIRIAYPGGNGTGVGRLSGKISGPPNADLMKTGSGRLELTGPNDYLGNTIVQKGILALNGGPNRLPVTTHLRLSGGQCELGFGSQQVRALSGFELLDIRQNNFRVEGDISTTYNGEIRGANGDPSGSFTKAGSSVLELTWGRSNVSGGFAVEGGTLLFNNIYEFSKIDGGISGTSVSSGAILGGNGFTRTPVNVLSGGILMPGPSASRGSVGNLATGELILDSGAILRADLGDQVRVTGPVTLANSHLEVRYSGSFTHSTQIYYLIDNDDTDPVVGTFATIDGVPPGYTVTYTADRAEDSAFGGNDVALLPPVDTDDDRVPDFWEIANGTDPDASDAGSDDDGDGQNNLAEYEAGTDPQDSSSVFRIVQVLRISPGFLQITWNAVADKTYRVTGCADFENGWTTLIDGLTASTTGTLTQTIQDDGGDSYFVRVEIAE